MANEEALKLKKQIHRLDMKEAKLSAERYGLIRQMELVCIHNDIEKKYKYEAGGYLDRCKYINKIVCKTCGKVISEDIQLGGFE